MKRSTTLELSDSITEVGESPLAVIVRADDSLTADDVISHCEGKLAPFKTVKAVEFIDVIPRNASGKFLKRNQRAIQLRRNRITRAVLQL